MPLAHGLELSQKVHGGKEIGMEGSRHSGGEDGCVGEQNVMKVQIYFYASYFEGIK